VCSFGTRKDSIGGSYPDPKNHKGARATIAAGEHLSRYTKRPEKKELEGGVPSFLRTLKDAASEIEDLSEKQIIESVRSYRSANRLQPEVEVVS